ncbi:MAG: porin family protein [Acidobacteria bacterium]|nr:porin family protein [Acidobacteriota bacterium]
MRLPHAIVFLGVLLAGTSVSAPAYAQNSGFGLGGRFSFVRGDPAVEASSARYSGGLLRWRLSPRRTIELSLDYRSRLNQDLTERVKDYPFQGSLLLYPVRASISPYLLGGVGWYSQRVDTLDKDQVVSQKTSRTFGYHAGIGGEMKLGQRAAAHLDYRYTFIGLGSKDPTAPSGALSIPGLQSFQNRLNLSHKGSMWTSGVTVYF